MLPELELSTIRGVPSSSKIPFLLRSHLTPISGEVENYVRMIKVRLTKLGEHSNKSGLRNALKPKSECKYRALSSPMPNELKFERAVNTFKTNTQAATSRPLVCKLSNCCESDRGVQGSSPSPDRIT